MNDAVIDARNLAWPTVAKHCERAGLWRFSALIGGEIVTFGGAFRHDRNERAWLVSARSVESARLDGAPARAYLPTLGAAAWWALGTYLAE